MAKRKEPSGTKPWKSRRANDLGLLDVFEVEPYIKFLLVVDAGTRDLGISVLTGESAQCLYEAYLYAYGFERGPHKRILSDSGGAFASNDFCLLMNGLNVRVSKSGAENSQAHGSVERQILTLQNSVTAIKAGPNPPSGKHEWEITLKTIVNNIRNEVMVGGYSASQRTLGRNTHISSNFFSTNLATQDRTAISRSEDLTRMAKAIYDTQMSKDRLEQIMRERPQQEVMFTDQQNVYYRVNAVGGKKGGFGIGRVCGITIEDGHRVYKIDTGASTQLRRVGADLRPRYDELEIASDGSLSEPGIDDDDDAGSADDAGAEEDAEVEAAAGDDVVADAEVGAEVPVVVEQGVRIGRRQARRKFSNSTTLPSAGGENTFMQKCCAKDSCIETQTETKNLITKSNLVFENALYAKTKNGPLEDNLCYPPISPTWDMQKDYFNFYTRADLNTDGLNVETPQASDSPVISTGYGMDSYGWDWSQLSAAEQKSARMKGVEDYDYWDCWSDETFSENQLPEGSTKLLGRWVDKVKFVDGRLIGKCRWTPKGFLDKRKHLYALDSPTVSATSVKSLLTLALSDNGNLFTFDISAAFFQSQRLTRTDIFVEYPPDCHTKEMVLAGHRYFKRLQVAVPGTVQAPIEWRTTFDEWCTSLGLIRSKVDPCVYFSGTISKTTGRPDGFMALHVDDGIGCGSPRFLAFLKENLLKRFKVGEFKAIKVDESFEYTGVEYKLLENGIEFHQQKYISQKLVECKVPDSIKSLPEEFADEALISNFRSAIGSGIWISVKSRPDAAFSVSYAAQNVTQLQVKHINALNKSFRYVKETPLKIFLPKMDLSGGVKIVTIVDASTKSVDAKDRAQVGRLIGLAPANVSVDFSKQVALPFSLIEHRSGRAARVTTGSYGAETVCAVESTKASMNISHLVAEYFYGPAPSISEQLLLARLGQNTERTIPIELFTDSHGILTAVNSTKNDQKIDASRRIDINLLKEAIAVGELRVYHIDGVGNPSDSLTKDRSSKDAKVGEAEMINILTSGRYCPKISSISRDGTSKKNRKK